MSDKIKNIIWYSGDKYVMVLMSFVTTIILSRTLSPSILGEIVLLQSFVIFFGVITLLALDSIFIKKLTESEQHVSTIFFVKMAASIVSVLFFVIYIFCVESNLDFVSKLILGLPLCLSFTNIVELVLMANKKIYTIASKTLPLYLIIGLVKCPLLFIIADVKLICFLLVIEQVAIRGYVLYYGLKMDLISFGLLTINSKKIKDSVKLFNEGKLLVLSSFFLIGFVRTNQILVNELLGSESLAYYSMPIKIVDGLTILITTYVSSVYPYLLSSIKERGEIKTAEIYFGAITKFAFILTMALFFFADTIILTIFGEKYLDSVSVLKIYSVALFFNYLFISSGRWFIALSQHNFVAWRNFIAFSLNLILSYMLIPNYGINGAAFSVLISWFVAGYLSCIISHQNRWLLITIPCSLLKRNNLL